MVWENKWSLKGTWLSTKRAVANWNMYTHVLTGICTRNISQIGFIHMLNAYIVRNIKIVDFKKISTTLFEKDYKDTI